MEILILLFTIKLLFGTFCEVGKGSDHYRDR